MKKQVWDAHWVGFNAAEWKLMSLDFLSYDARGSIKLHMSLYYATRESWMDISVYLRKKTMTQRTLLNYSF